ncbi:ABC-type dipeptide/oligopeptide/nickel transport system, permease component [Actinoalloteichus sp. GBA129-24]|uniref:Oligopeptide transport system permease protein OppC n=1 Tax=Actinoalloteichus fjordicus TaxID=1612552 RepID=A0AAC9LAQ7_9PSEU|nr:MULTISPECIES: ABC transporter permease [Actinoalloteichus]APU12955.1 ABC-type dipeptide/oligopeptide/nickel transport system, permease component [Actinoalloteichus fjordicus]APU18926.1 ABC-type dipeptide/oligopeptide/nickel transport system, permease component [Actinoalloteichus sp. GBA129-24]
MAEIVSTTTPGTPGEPPSQSAGEFGTAARKQWQIVLRRFMQHKLAMISLVVLVLLILFALIAPMFWHYSYTYTGGGRFEDPSPDHPLGTDQIGRDMFAVLLRGTQFSLLIAMVVALMATAIGVLLGATAGLLGGFVDSLVMRFVDLMLIIPQIALVGIAAAIFGGSWYLVAIALGLFSWMSVARINRGQTLSLAQREFVEAAKAMGASNTRIILKHILPNLTGIITVNATLAVATAVLAEAALSFIGLGVQIPDTSLGLVINANYNQFLTRPWLFWAPFLAILLISLTINFIGDGIRDAFDPRQTKVRA